MPQPAHPWRRYVALGDSLTEGLVDPNPDGSPRGWADQFAQHLADAAGAPVSTPTWPFVDDCCVRSSPSNSSRRWPQTRSGQPVGRGNDILRPRADPDAITAELERAVVRLREAGIEVILGTGIDARIRRCCRSPDPGPQCSTPISGRSPSGTALT